MFFSVLIGLFPVTLHATRRETSDTIVSHIPRQAVVSSALASIGYSKRLHILEIEFSNGAIYRYFEVPPSVYRDIISVESKARYYDTNIRGNYRSVRVRPRLNDATSR